MKIWVCATLPQGWENNTLLYTIRWPAVVINTYFRVKKNEVHWWSPTFVFQKSLVVFSFVFQKNSGVFCIDFQKSESVSSGSPLTQSHMEQVHDMMADAMKESTSPNTSREGNSNRLIIMIIIIMIIIMIIMIVDIAPFQCYSYRNVLVKILSNQKFWPTGFGSPSHDGAHGTELYFFPDESQTAPKPQWADPAGRNMAQYISDEEEITGSTLSEDTEQVSSGEEFCIIDDLGLGISVRNLQSTYGYV